MSIDVEGNEMIALQQLNVSLGKDGLPYPRISVILIEWRKVNKDRYKQMLEPLGYLSVRIGKGPKVFTDEEPSETSDELFWHPSLIP